MIQRPFIWVFLAYLSGILLAWNKISPKILFVLIITICFLLFLLLYRIKNGAINRKDSFLWSVPVLLALGFYAMGVRMEPPIMDNVFEQEASCTLTGEISMIVKKQWGVSLYVKDNQVTILPKDPPYLVENIIVNSSDHQTYLVGNKITVSGKIEKFSSPANPGQFNERSYYKIQNIDYKVKADTIVIIDSGYSKFHRMLDLIKRKLLRTYETILPEKEAGAVIAMLLGEKYLLGEEIKQLYQENGISHILAISGLHVSMIGLSLYTLLRKLRTGLIPATFLSILLIFSYGVLTNFSVSTNRAVVMFIVMLLAKILGKTYDMLSALSLCGFLILLQNPLQIFHVGFLLSFGAVLGIAVILPCLRIYIQSSHPIISGLLISISAQVMTLPMIMVFFYQIPCYSIIINLLVLPLVSILMLTSIAAGLVGSFSIPLGVFLIGGSNYILKLYEGICRLGSRLPGNLYTVGSPEGLRIILFAVFLGFFLWGSRRYQKKSITLTLVIAIILLIYPKGGGAGLEITMLEVGQGEAIFLETDTGNTYLIDGGSADVSKVGTYRLQPFLLFKGVDKIDYAIVTHADRDHVSGLIELLEDGRIRIRNLVLPDIGLKENDLIYLSDTEQEAYRSLESLASKKGVKTSYIKAGDIIRDGDIRFTCLHPVQGYNYSTSNSYSTVISVNYKNFDMLLTGDLEEEGEKFLMEQFIMEQFLNKQPSMRSPEVKPLYALDYDVLKVAHHGSRYSTMEEFLQRITPEYALISCGKDNSYGHPHEELLNRLKGVGSETLITYESGAITILTDGERMEIREFRRD